MILIMKMKTMRKEKKENKNRKNNHIGKEIYKKIKIILLGESKVGKQV